MKVVVTNVKVNANVTVSVNVIAKVYVTERVRSVLGTGQDESGRCAGPRTWTLAWTRLWV